MADVQAEAAAIALPVETCPVFSNECSGIATTHHHGTPVCDGCRSYLRFIEDGGR